MRTAGRTCEQQRQRERGEGGGAHAAQHGGAHALDFVWGGVAGGVGRLCRHGALGLTGRGAC